MLDKIRFYGISTILVVGLISASPADAGSKKLSGDEIRAALTNKTLIGENYAKGITVRIFSGPNGEWLSQPGPNKIIEFEWSVKGDKHCKGRGCGPVISKGEPNVYYKKMRGEERFKYTVIGNGNLLE